MRMQVWSLALFSDLRIRYCCGCGAGYSSNLVHSMRTSICHRCGPKKDKKEKKVIENCISGCLIIHLCLRGLSNKGLGQVSFDIWRLLGNVQSRGNELHMRHVICGGAFKPIVSCELCIGSLVGWELNQDTERRWKTVKANFIWAIDLLELSLAGFIHLNWRGILVLVYFDFLS